ncbi:MAG: periplasmic heavy metal sensor [Pseudomonadales bacterium]|jgi:hypothetical protein
MRHHRYRCFGPSWAFAYAYGAARPDDDAADNRTWYAHRGHDRHGWQGGRPGRSFGVRRPLRYLSYQLDLDESQRRKIAIALDSVKTEREQATLDDKRMAADLAEAILRPDLSTEALNQALAGRLESTRRVQAKVAAALKDIAETLDSDQREEFAYLVRTGAFRI